MVILESVDCSIDRKNKALKVIHKTLRNIHENIELHQKHSHYEAIEISPAGNFRQKSNPVTLTFNAYC